jgi:hypothetical protein
MNVNKTTQAEKQTETKYGQFLTTTIPWQARPVAKVLAHNTKIANKVPQEALHNAATYCWTPATKPTISITRMWVDPKLQTKHKPKSSRMLATRLAELMPAN